jgi:hypothetical protein
MVCRVRARLLLVQRLPLHRRVRCGRELTYLTLGVVVSRTPAISGPPTLVAGNDVASGTLGVRPSQGLQVFSFTQLMANRKTPTLLACSRWMSPGGLNNGD